MSDVIMELRAHIQTLENEVYFLQKEVEEKSFLLRSLITVKQNANNCSSLPTTPEISKSSSPLSKKQTLPSNKNNDFHIDNNGLKNKHISDVNKVKKVFLSSDNKQIKDNKTEDQTTYTNKDNSHTTTMSKNNSNNNNNNTNSNNNNYNNKDTITPNP